MATILKNENRAFQAGVNRIDNFNLLTDVSRLQSGLKPQNLNFDLRQLNPGQFSAPYHFHRYAEELFMVISGSMALRSPSGFEIISAGDIVFCEIGENGAHQFYNHSEEPCTYLDIRTFIGYDVCDYPDTGKMLLAPSYEIFNKEAAVGYWEGEENVKEKWQDFDK